MAAWLGTFPMSIVYFVTCANDFDVKPTLLRLLIGERACAATTADALLFSTGPPLSLTACSMVSSGMAA